MTHGNDPELLFQDLGLRHVVARFNGGPVISDAGGLSLREVEAKFHFIDQFATCFTDHRHPDLVEHTLPELLKQRIFALCLDYEDLNDHDRLRHDPLLAVLVGKKDPTGCQRARARDRGKALAGKSTLNRLELTPVRANTASFTVRTGPLWLLAVFQLHGKSKRPVLFTGVDSALLPGVLVPSCAACQGPNAAPPTGGVPAEAGMALVLLRWCGTAC